jgi:hypothetical protein
MNTSQNFRNMSVKELKEICRREPQKYRGFSSLKKADLIHFMYQKNSTQPRRSRPRESYNISDVAHIFETPDEYEERIQSYYEPKPEDSIIQDLVSSLQRRYPTSSVAYDSHNDEYNDMIYKGNKGKYISQYGSLGEHGEMILYHGTDGQNLLSILSDDFRLTSNPVHGHMYGKGIYFTNDIEKAIYYSERGKSTKYVIVCNVHIGDICLGNAAMGIHPKMPGRDKTYDTSVDDIRSPKQFIKKKNGTYNILGIITIENYNEKTNYMNKRFSGSFQITNKTNKKLALYWIPPGVSYNVYNVNINRCKYMNIIPPLHNGLDGVLGMKSQKYHVFATVIYNRNSQYSTRDIVKIFMLTKHNQIINIDPYDL